MYHIVNYGGYIVCEVSLVSFSISRHIELQKLNTEHQELETKYNESVNQTFKCICALVCIIVCCHGDDETN